MAVTNLKATKSIDGALDYVRNEKESNDIDNPRVLSFSAHKCSFNDCKDDFRIVREHYRKTDGVQGFTTITSFALDEVEPDDIEQVDNALQAVKKAHLEAFGNDRQMLFIAQADGQGGKLHIHGVVANIDINTGMKIPREQRNYYRFRAITDETLEEFNIKNKNKDCEYHTNSYTQAEKEMKQRGQTPWKEELKQSVINVQDNFKGITLEEYKRALSERGIEIVIRGGKRSSAPKITYQLNNGDKVLKARESRLGVKSYDEVLDIIQSNKIALKERKKADKRIYYTEPMQNTSETIKSDIEPIKEPKRKIYNATQNKTIEKPLNSNKMDNNEVNNEVVQKIAKKRQLTGNKMGSQDKKIIVTRNKTKENPKNNQSIYDDIKKFEQLNSEIQKNDVSLDDEFIV